MKTGMKVNVAYTAVSTSQWLCQHHIHRSNNACWRVVHSTYGMDLDEHGQRPLLGQSQRQLWERDTARAGVLQRPAAACPSNPTDKSNGPAARNRPCRPAVVQGSFSPDFKVAGQICGAQFATTFPHRSRRHTISPNSKIRSTALGAALACPAEQTFSAAQSISPSLVMLSIDCWSVLRQRHRWDGALLTVVRHYLP